MLYDIMSNSPQSTLDLENTKSKPHVNGIVGSSQSKFVDLATSQMPKLTMQKPTTGPATSQMQNITMQKPTIGPTTRQMQKLTMQKPTTSIATSSTTPTTQSSDVHYV